MTVDRNILGIPNAKKIRIHEQYEILDWCRRLECTPEQLQDAVRNAGTSIQAVEDYLKKQKQEA